MKKYNVYFTYGNEGDSDALTFAASSEEDARKLCIEYAHEIYGEIKIEEVDEVYHTATRRDDPEQRYFDNYTTYLERDSDNGSDY